MKRQIYVSKPKLFSIVDPKILAKNRSKDKKKMEQMMWEGAKDMGLETVLSDRCW